MARNMRKQAAGIRDFTGGGVDFAFEAAGVPVPDPALQLLHERTEGWAAGLRLAALSMSGA